MNVSARYANALFAGMIVALLAGCGGSQPPIGEPRLTYPGAMRQRTAAPACNGGHNGQAQCAALIDVGPAHSNKPRGLTPRDLQSAYKLPSSTKGTGQIVGIVDAYDNPDVASDLTEYRSRFKLPTANFTKFNQEGQQYNYPQGSPGWGVAIDQDVEMASASCPNCTIYLIEANSPQWSDLQSAEAEAVTLGAHIVSNSFAGTGAKKKYFDTPGVTYLGATTNGLSEPADFGSVVAVGETELEKGGTGKRGWQELVSPTSSEGRCVKAIRRPSWQRDQYCKHRLANDVAANAIGVAVYDSYAQGGWIEIDGGGAVPFLAGVFGLAGNADKQDGGRTFWSPAHEKHLYSVGEGHDGECLYAYKTYNTCTGWGTPDGIGAF